jgi:nucleoside-diphosphate-sugar epimerase
MNTIHTEAELDEALSRPTAGVLDTLNRISGDVLVLGASGKMGPTLARMLRRAMDDMGQPQRRVIAVARFSNAGSETKLRQHGVDTIACDLTDRAAVAALPEAPNVIFMVGQKFGTSDAPELTWVVNTIVPAIIAERYARSRIVVFSTGCVYPLMPSDSSGARESDPLTPPGEYANSCVGRERVFEHFAKTQGTHLLMFRLCYAIDLRYGVLHDIARKVWQGEPVDVSMGVANVIWQGDANARAIQCLAFTDHPPIAVNVTGLTPIRIRDVALRFGELLGKAPQITGSESAKAWIWDASKSYAWFGPPSVSEDEMIQATAQWIKQGGGTLGKPTHFEVQDGQF